MFSEELKESTRHVHAALEKKLVGHIRNINTVEDYIQLLEMMYGYYHPLEQHTRPFINDAAHGRIAGNILEDIAGLAPSYQPAPQICGDLPQVNSRWSALGTLYVTEGSTLGGRIITKMIAGRLNLSIETGFSFFNAYGDKTEAMWDHFKTILNEPASADERQQVKRSAEETFKKFNDWVVLYESAISQ